MSLTHRLLILALMLLTGGMGVATTARANEPTADTAKSSLTKRAYPWYDAKKDAFRPLRPPKEDSTVVPNLSFIQILGNLFGPFLQIVIWGILGILILTALIVFLRSAGMGDPLVSSHKSEPATIDLETIEALPEPVRGVSDLLSEAERRAAQSAFDQAILFYYGWQLLQLDRQQLIEVQKGKTNRQYRREVAVTKPVLNDVFRESIRLFEEAFFGKRPISREAFEHVWNQRHRFQPNPGKAR